MSSSEQLFQRIAPSELASGSRSFAFTNLYGCEDGMTSRIGAFCPNPKGRARRQPVQDFTTAFCARA